jgi:hypothetical protein
VLTSKRTGFSAVIPYLEERELITRNYIGIEGVLESSGPD